MIKGGADAGGLNDLIHWSEGDFSMCFLPFMCDVKAASSILATLTSLEHIATVSFFPNPALELFIFKSSCLEKENIFRHFLPKAKRKQSQESKLQHFLHFISRNW